MRFKRSY